MQSTGRRREPAEERGESFGFHHGKTPVDDFSHQGAVGFIGGVIMTNCCRASSRKKIKNLVAPAAPEDQSNTVVDIYF